MSDKNRPVYYILILLFITSTNFCLAAHKDEIQPFSNWPEIIYASAKGKHAEVYNLIQQGADVNVTDDERRTAL
ncbi:MAG: hypothetical protein R3240_01505, partial [Gammaproteobacteria bacterium]|nr:hypothetical protein [Gammaproteobacteria bacterium]